MLIVCCADVNTTLHPRDQQLSRDLPRDLSTMSCRGLRSKRYLSDGFCRSLRPISEVLCTGRCVSGRHAALSPDYLQLLQKSTSGRGFEWRCVDADVRIQRKKLICDNGDIRVYRVRVVKSCSCRRTDRRHHDQRSKHSSRKYRLNGRNGGGRDGRDGKLVETQTAAATVVDEH